MSSGTPFAFRYDAERSVMVPKLPRLADRHYVDGQWYTLAIVEDRSGASHRHYHAAIKDAWLSLPEPWAERFPTETHLRKYALVKAGYCDVQEFAVSSHAEALRLAAFVRGIDEYAVVLTKDKTVQRFTAKSQNYRTMNKAEFETSKAAVLEVIAGIIGVTAGDLRANAARAAA
jgi:hypothetical protein